MLLTRAQFEQLVDIDPMPLLVEEIVASWVEAAYPLAECRLTPRPKPNAKSEHAARNSEGL